jgi:hypothetical protein
MMPGNRPCDERHRAGNDPPREHDAGDPLAGAEPLQQQIRRHLEHEVGDEEDAGAESVLRRRQPEILVHRQRGEADVDAIEVRDEVADD